MELLKHLQEIEPHTQIGYVLSSEIESVDIVEPIFRKRSVAKPSHYLNNARTVISIAVPVCLSKETYQIVSATNPYKGYGEIFNISKACAKYLRKQGYSSKVAHGLNQKLCALKAGHGVIGKNSLIINEKYGTRLRLDCVVTDYIPTAYSKELLTDLCGDCDICSRICKHGCLHSRAVNSMECYNHYLPKRTLQINQYMCNRCQYYCPYNATYIKESKINEISYTNR